MTKANSTDSNHRLPYAFPDSLVEQQLIHAPGSIQPHGVLLAFEERDLTILQVSNNTQEYLGVEAEQLLGETLDAVLDSTQLQILRQHLTLKAGQRSWVKLFIAIKNNDTQFNGSLHRIPGATILELEPISFPDKNGILEVHFLLNQAITRIKQTSSSSDLLKIFVDEVRTLTGFDRVHVYQFDEQGAGEVVAEAKQEYLEPYLGLHFPAFDIPEQVRSMYELELLRIVPDLSARPVEILPTLHPVTQKPLDLGHALLRSVDPCCTKYYENMGSKALLVASIMKEGELWGLLSCHHQDAKYIPHDVKLSCNLLTQITSSELGIRLKQEELSQQAQIYSLEAEVIQSIAESDNFLDALINPAFRLIRLVNAQGVAVCMGEQITLLGQTPTQEQTDLLAEWLHQEITDNPFYTNCLSKFYPEAENFTDSASGLLFLSISKVLRYGILWFRPEVVQTVIWGGNPNDSIQVDSVGEQQLCPRSSFKTWKEIVQNTSLPWHQREINSAINLRNAIVGIVLKKADELAKLNQDLQRSNRELASFSYAAAHDLKEPLRGIYNYATILLEDYAQVLDEEGLEYLTDIQSFSQRMETLINSLLRTAQLRQTTLQRQPTDLNELLDEVIDVIRAGRPETPFSLRQPKPLPQVLCDAPLIREVFHNLIINAIKYNDRSEKWVEIGCKENTSSSTDTRKLSPTSLIFFVRDNGIGIRKRNLPQVFKLFKRLHPQELYGGGAGVGLAIARQIVEIHGGDIWVESTLGEGSTFYFTLQDP